MAKQTSRLRLDEILIQEGLITEEEIKEALLRQKAHGGKFGSQLLYHRYIDEASLVKALAKQLDCEYVVLSKYDINEYLVEMIPQKVAIARKVMPFDYDIDNNILKVACTDPNDTNLYNELNFVTHGKDVRLYVAAELVINTAIAKYYLGEDVSLEDNLLLEIPDITTDTGKTPIIQEEDKPEEVVDDRRAILIVSDETYAVPMMQSLFERDNFRVVVLDDADTAIEILDETRFHAVLIKDTVSGDYLDLIDRIRKSSPQTLVRYYESVSSLFLHRDTFNNESELFLKNLDLFTSVLSSHSKSHENHAGRVGQYVDRLCRRLKLPTRDRLKIVNAAYLHDLARYYYSSDEASDGRAVVDLTVKLLSSLNYSPVIEEMLRRMYFDLKGKFTKRLPIEVLGGNIVTIADLYCESTEPGEKLPLDKFDAIKRKLRDMAGRVFLPEVVEAFIDMMQNEILTQHTEQNLGQIMIYAEQLRLLQPLELRLKNEGYRTLSQSSTGAFAELCHRSRPDLIILVAPGDKETVHNLVNTLINEGVPLADIPTFLLNDDQSQIPELTGLLEKGIEDIIAIGNNLDLLVTKINKLREKLREKEDTAQRLEKQQGAHGRLADMNLIDLLQALGPSRKTVKITVLPSDDDADLLTLYLLQGQITYAGFKDLHGPEAVYEGLTWTDGTWRIEPITDDDIPETNNDLPNESLLMEGCRLIDEKIRSGKLL